MQCSVMKLPSEKAGLLTNSFGIVKRLWSPGNKLRVSEGRGLGGGTNGVMGIKEGTCCDEHWVLYLTIVSLNTTSKTNDILYSG